MLSTWVALVMAAASVDAPVTAVTVYSDSARVTRTAQVAAGADRILELPLLLDTIEPASIRLVGEGVQVKRVDIARVQASEFPATQAKKLLDALDALDDQGKHLEGERQSAQVLLQALDRIHPALPNEVQRPLPKLNPSGWSAALGFEASWRQKLQAQVRDAAQKLEVLSRERAKVAAEAQQLDATRRGGFRVTAHLAAGSGHLELTYLAHNARWYPVYDLTLDPNRSRVEVAFAAQVSQQTGEDWDDARLTVSTSVPANATELPQLLTWKLGDKERFMPTPTPVVERVPPPPRPVPPLALANLDEALLRQRLANRLGGVQGQARDTWRSAVGDIETASPEEEDNAPTSPGSRAELDEDKEQLSKPMPSAPPPAPAPRQRSYAPAAAPSMAMPESESMPSRTVSFAAETVASTGFGLAPPPGYTPRTFAANLPASLAGGYDLVFHAVQPETVPSSGAAKRVALFAVSWPVTVQRKLFPALAPEAFLVAELKNPQPTALPGGEANLFVGQDPAGTAHLDFVAPGEKFTLPLGLDRALKPVRNVKLVQGERGVFSKDQLNQYEVTTELANPYSVPISVELFDQWPVTTDEHVEVKLLSSAPFAKQDPVKGSLEWDLTLPPHQKTTVRFSYSLRTPTDYRLHQ